MDDTHICILHPVQQKVSIFSIEVVKILRRLSPPLPLITPSSPLTPMCLLRGGVYRVAVKKSDPYAYICMQCLYKLELMYEFRNVCVRSNDKLQNYLKSTGDTIPAEREHQVETEGSSDDVVIIKEEPMSSSPPRPICRVKQRTEATINSWNTEQLINNNVESHEAPVAGTSTAIDCELNTLSDVISRNGTLHENSDADLPMLCASCGEIFDSQDTHQCGVSLLSLKKRRNAKAFKCEICNKRYKFQSNWRRHKLSNLHKEAQKNHLKELMKLSSEEQNSAGSITVPCRRLRSNLR